MNLTIQDLQTIGRMKKITKDFRLFCSGRLLWRSRHPHWKKWNTADIAIVIHRDKTRQAFTTLSEIEAYIIDCLAYPDDGHTRDFEKPRKKAQSIVVRRLTDLSRNLEGKPQDCPECGKKAAMIKHIVQSPIPGEDHITYCFHQCDYCLTSDHEDLVTELNHYWKPSDFPF